MAIKNRRFKFRRLREPIVIPEKVLSALGQIYPYELFSYKDLAQEAQTFLGRQFPSHKPYHDVVGITNHNGQGRQWGIILFRYPNHEWEIMAEFNHRSLGLWWRLRFVRWLSKYLQHQHYAFNKPRELGSLIPSR